jgi:hypothetical protein
MCRSAAAVVLEKSMMMQRVQQQESQQLSGCWMLQQWGRAQQEFDRRIETNWNTCALLELQERLLQDSKSRLRSCRWLPAMSFVAAGRLRTAAHPLAAARWARCPSPASAVSRRLRPYSRES